MKYGFTLWIVVFALSCGPTEKPKDFFTATVSTKDSLLLLDDVPMHRIAEVLEQERLSGIEFLRDSLEIMYKSMEDSAGVSGLDRQGRLRILLSNDAPLRLAIQVFASGYRAGFRDIRIVAEDSVRGSMEIPVGPNHHSGLKHYVSMDTSGLRLYTEFRTSPPAEGPTPDRQAGLLVRLGQLPTSRPLLIRGGLQPLKKELDWMTGELEKIGFSGGRFFSILCDPDARVRDFVEISSVVIESMSKPAAVTTAALFDVAYPPPTMPQGEFRYFNGYSASFEKFSIGMGLASSDVGDTILDVDGRHDLLGLPCILYSAIEQDNEARLARLCEIGFDVNRACFLEFKTNEEWNGYTPLMMAIHFDRPKLVALLLNAGADVQKRSKKFKVKIPSLLGELSKTREEWRGREISPIRLAKERKSDAVIRLLLAAGAKE